MAAPAPPSRTWPSSLGPAPARRETGASGRRIPWMATSTRVDRRAAAGRSADGEDGVSAGLIGVLASQVVGGVDDGSLAGVVNEGVLNVKRVRRGDARDQVLLAQAVQRHPEPAAEDGAALVEEGLDRAFHVLLAGEAGVTGGREPARRHAGQR